MPRLERRLAGTSDARSGVSLQPWALTSTQMATVQPDIAKLPGADLVERGIEDLHRGHESPEALLVSIGVPRLRLAGIQVQGAIAEPEHKLYLLLARQRGNAAHSAYNALIRRLVSFERATACVS